MTKENKEINPEEKARGFEYKIGKFDFSEFGYKQKYIACLTDNPKVIEFYSANLATHRKIGEHFGVIEKIIGGGEFEIGSLFDEFSTNGSHSADYQGIPITAQNEAIKFAYNKLNRKNVWMSLQDKNDYPFYMNWNKFWKQK